MHLYLHVPFCARRCSYCDFAIAVRREVPSRAFVRAVMREWNGWQRHPIWAESGEVHTVYFGGGTPSRLLPAAVGELIEGIARARPLRADAEVTLEANPDDVTPSAAAAWHSAGVNRVSLGVQSFDPAVLAWMHRTHRSEQVAPAVEVLRGAGISNISLDLIFGLPARLGRDWERDLDLAFTLAPDHLSLYGLTVEEHTPLARWAERGEVTPVDEDRYAAEFLAADLALIRHGFEHYEVSNAARPERRARHNSAYWRRSPFIGLGPSAHSGFGLTRRWNLREWAAYERASNCDQSVVAGTEELSAEAVELEEIYLGLRTAEGLPVGRLDPGLVEAWRSASWAEATDGRIRLTAEGWLRLDALVGAAMTSPRHCRA
ncbi:MAG TPA: radical SAM family heme chaperone HemW [Gemmatimonadales bacterium]|nr:radical SAM family heme chaperone HemW [Gemmatimonadales bacterium]